MTDKTSLELDNFDFGFSLVDADEMNEVQELRTAVATSDKDTEEWMEQAEQWRNKAQTMYKAIQPLLSNLASQPDKEYIYWPGTDRVDKINAFKLKLMQILED